MFIKRNKSRPSLRARESDLEGDVGSPLGKSTFTAEGAGDTSMDVDEESGSVMERKKLKKRDKRKDGLGQSGRLSFGGDDAEASDSTPFKPKKSLLSQQIKLPSTPATITTESPSSSIYSKEYISQLKAATPSRLPRNSTEEGLSDIAKSKYGDMLMEDTTAGIPDDAAIASAKTKRQTALQSEKLGGEDFISLGGGQLSVYDGEQGPHPESRLMREEDEEGEGDEDLADFTEANTRLPLGRNANKQAARRMKGEIGEMIADREAEDEDDEEANEWELAQVRRAAQWEEEAQDEKPVKQGYRAVPIPMARPMPTLAPAQARLAASLAEMDIDKKENERLLESTAQELAALEEQERELRSEVGKVEGKREWVEGFRAWVEMLGGFLEEKASLNLLHLETYREPTYQYSYQFPKLEDIEADSLHHLKERAELVKKRRSEDDSDDLALFLGVPSSSGETDDVSSALPHSSVRRTRRAQRDSRRLKRKRVQPEEDGFSTDASLASVEAEDFEEANAKLEHRVHALLEDVKAEDFRDPDDGLAVRFGEWRRKYEEEYGNAFGGLAMIQAWEFWARGEMVGWEPLRVSETWFQGPRDVSDPTVQGSSTLESFRWFHSLHKYSRPSTTASNKALDADEMDLDEEPPLGIDGDLVSSMVSTAVVPLLTKSFEAGAYDPYSNPQTRRAIDLTDVVADLTGKDSRKFTVSPDLSLHVPETLTTYPTGPLEVHSGDLPQPPVRALGHDLDADFQYDHTSAFFRPEYSAGDAALCEETHQASAESFVVAERGATGDPRAGYEVSRRGPQADIGAMLGRRREGDGAERKFDYWISVELTMMQVSVVGTNVLPPDLISFLRDGPRAY
ncbi:hypothetical protein P7C73_g6329, partial [Tremellales sp. Uapishka_1]